MLYIIIGLVVLGLIMSLFSWLSDLVGGGARLFIIIIILVASFLALSWMGVFLVIVVGVLVTLLKTAGHYVNTKVVEHDQRANETARVKQQTQKERQTHDNDYALMQELNKNCLWLGYMDKNKWRKKLPNFVDRKYSSSFDEITSNFAKQIEQQNILQNDDWFEPYKRYVVEHEGSTVTKMLVEVNCPQLKMTHCTPDGDLINTWLMRGTKRVSDDVPALFDYTFIQKNNINENLFAATEYLKYLYHVSDVPEDKSQNNEIDFDDL